VQKYKGAKKKTKGLKEGSNKGSERKKGRKVSTTIILHVLY
jgi:hypothetical protein